MLRLRRRLGQHVQRSGFVPRQRRSLGLGHGPRVPLRLYSAAHLTTGYCFALREQRPFPLFSGRKAGKFF